MKKQRALFLGFITVFFVVCYMLMGQNYDALARYAYANEDNRDAILAVVSKADIQLLIDYDIRPEEFLPFIKVEGFDLRNSKAYYEASLVKSDSKDKIVSSVNIIVSHMSMETMLLYLDDYSFDEIIDWVENKDVYNKNSIFIYRPTSYDTILTDVYTVGRYVPKDLESVTSIRTLISKGQMQLSKETNEALNEMCSLLKDEFNESCGGLIATKGYISYEDQIALYDEYLLQYGPSQTEFMFPGHNEWQLGNTLEVTIKGDSDFVSSEQYQWILENGADFGFVFRSPNSSVLRYVGKDLAKRLVDSGMTLEEIRVEE